MFARVQQCCVLLTAFLCAFLHRATPCLRVPSMHPRTTFCLPFDRTGHTVSVQEDLRVAGTTVCTHTYTRTRARARTHTHALARADTHTHTHTCVRARVCTHSTCPDEHTRSYILGSRDVDVAPVVDVATRHCAIGFAVRDSLTSQTRSFTDHVQVVCHSHSCASYTDT
jgi:hypothetical protein